MRDVYVSAAGYTYCDATMMVVGLSEQACDEGVEVAADWLQQDAYDAFEHETPEDVHVWRSPYGSLFPILYIARTVRQTHGIWEARQMIEDLRHDGYYVVPTN